MAAQYSGVIQPKQLYFVHFSLCLSAEFRDLANALFYLQVTAESTTHILKRDNLESNAGYMGSPNDIRSFVQRPERDSQPCVLAPYTPILVCFRAVDDECLKYRLF